MACKDREWWYTPCVPQLPPPTRVMHPVLFDAGVWPTRVMCKRDLTVAGRAVY